MPSSGSFYDCVIFGILGTLGRHKNAKVPRRIETAAALAAAPAAAATTAAHHYPPLPVAGIGAATRPGTPAICPVRVSLLSTVTLWLLPAEPETQGAYLSRFYRGQHPRTRIPQAYNFS